MNACWICGWVLDGSSWPAPGTLDGNALVVLRLAGLDSVAGFMKGRSSTYAVLAFMSGIILSVPFVGEHFDRDIQPFYCQHFFILWYH